MHLPNERKVLFLMANINMLVQQISTLDHLKQVVQDYGVQLDRHNKGLCPFHKEKTPSFFLYTNSSGKGCFKCHGCGEQGDIISFIMLQEVCTFNEALRKAYEILGMELNWEYNNIENFINFLKEHQQNYMDSYVYVDKEGNPVYMKMKYWDTEHNKKTFITKGLTQTEKSYKFNNEFSATSKHVYNLPQVLKAIINGKQVVVVEGEKDADNLIRRGFTATTIYSKHWDNNYTSELSGADIVFIGDTGQAGEEFKHIVWSNLKGKVNSFKVVELKDIDKLGDNKDVTDWLESGHTVKELYKCINNGWDWCISTKWKDVQVKENKDGTVVKTPLATSINLELLLQRNDTQLKYNIITKEIEAVTTEFYNSNLNTLATEITDQCNREGLKMSRDKVINNMDQIAHKNEYDPFKDYLDGLEGTWDKTSRLQDYINCFHTVPGYNLELKELIFKSWLMQFVDSTYNDNFKSQGMLVLKGRQGIFKTTSMSYLIPINEDWTFLSEQKYTDTRDCVQTITSNKLVELSEFARSAKAVDSLKGFVTAPVDKMVLKYDKFPNTFKRKTIFYATVNDDEFLVDDENRRFWVVDIESIDIDTLKEFDYNQLWAELWYLYFVMGETKCYLDKDEQQLLEVSNKSYQYNGDNITQLQLVFDFNSNIKIWLSNVEINDFMKQYTGKTIPNSVLGRELKKLGIKFKDTSKYGKRGKYFPIPIPREWEGKVRSKWTDRIVEDEDTPQFVEVEDTNNVVDLAFKNKKKTGTDIF